MQQVRKHVRRAVGRRGQTVPAHGVPRRCVLRALLVAIRVLLFAIRALLFAITVLLFAITVLLFAITVLLFAIRALLFAITVLLFAITVLLFAIRALLFAITVLLFAIRALLFAITVLLFAITVLLFAIRALLLASPNRAFSKGATGPPKWESHLQFCFTLAAISVRCGRTTASTRPSARRWARTSPARAASWCVRMTAGCGTDHVVKGYG